MADILRSLLFVPGSRPDRFEKALAADADLICIDLEDAVLPADKDAARQSVVDFISAGNKRLCVRINPLDTETGQKDLQALSEAGPSHVMLAKCKDEAQVRQCASRLTQSQIIGLIETIEGLNNAQQIARASDNMAALMFGGADMSAELRCEFSYEPLLFTRSQLVMAAAQANIDLIDVPFVNIKDDEGLQQETGKVRALGFTGKAAIHPCQIASIHTAFTPTPSQIEYAREVLAAVDGPDAGVVVVNGRMVDRPIILSCQRVMALAEAAQ